MNKYEVNYGVFITNVKFTNAARIADREGSPITLLDGNELYITLVKSYVLDGFYSDEE